MYALKKIVYVRMYWLILEPVQRTDMFPSQ
jgi:hypothetical protein